MKRWTYWWIVCLMMAFAPVYGQQSIQQADADFLLKNAERTVKNFGGFLTLIGASYTETDERKKAISQAMTLIEDYSVRIDNDLDPTGRLTRRMPAEDYLKSIRLFYRDESGVQLSLSDLRTDGYIYVDAKKKEYFAKVTATRYIKGLFYTSDGTKANEGVQEIDYYVTVLKGGERTKFSIFQISAAEPSPPRGVEKVKINEKSNLIFNDEEKEAIQAQLTQTEKEVSSLRVQLEREQRRRQEAEQAKSDAEELQLSETGRRLRLEKELDDCRTEKFTAEQTRRNALQEAQAQRLRAVKESARAERLGEQVAVWRRKAKAGSRVALQLGLGAGGFLANETNSEQIQTYMASLAFGYRLWGKEKKKNQRIRGWTLFSILNLGITPFQVAPRLAPDLASNMVPEDAIRFGEIELGLYIQQIVRLSAGRGLFFYSGLDTNGNIQNESFPYYIGTIGLTSPPVGTIPVFGVNFSYLTEPFPLEGTAIGDILNQSGEVRFDFFLRIQLE